MLVQPKASSGLYKNALHAARISKGWSMAELADRAGVSKTTIYEVENTRRPAQLNTAAALARALEINVEDLFEPTAQHD